MSYTNPSRIINKTAQEVQKGGQRMQDQLLTTSAEIAKASQIQKKQLAQLEEENIERENNFFDSVQNSTKGHQHLDSKVANTFEGLTKDYVEINRLAALGPPEGISKTEANLRRREIEQTPKQFQEQAGYLELEVKKYGESLKNGTMSSIGSPTNKAVLDAMYNDRDVEIARENGEFFYYIPKKDKDGKNLPWPENEGSLNGTKLAERSQSGEDLFNLKTETGGLTKTIWDKLSGEETGLGEYTITKSFENGDIHPTSGKPIEGLEDGYVQVIQMPNTGKKQNFIEEVEASGMLDGMLGDQKAMLSVWQDNIADGEKQEDGTYPPNTLASFTDEGGGSLGISLADMGLTMEEWQNSAYGEYPTDIGDEQKALIQTNQAKAAKRYLANNSWDENSLSPGASKTIGKRKKPDKKIDSPSNVNTGKPTKSLWELSKNNLKARQNFEEVRAKKEDITSKFKFLPEVIDTNAIEKVEAEMGFDEGSFSDQEGRSKEEFEKFLLEQIGVDANFLQLEEGYNKEQGINNKTTTTKVNKPATTNAAGGNNRLKS